MDGCKGGYGTFCGVMGMFSILAVVTAQGYICVQAHQTVHLQWMFLLYVSYTFKKLWKKKSD